MKPEVGEPIQLHSDNRAIARPRSGLMRSGFICELRRAGTPRGCSMLCLAVMMAVAGCGRTETRFDIYSTSDRDHPERFTEFFEPGAFSVSSLSNWRIVFDMPEVLIQVEDAAPANSPEGDAAAEPIVRTVPMAQYVKIEMFWRPLPGSTYAESSQINASIVYCLVTAADTISYEGAGFVFFKRSRDGKTITGRIESATLVPVRRVGSPRDIFGPCRLEATFTAKDDAAHVASIMRTLQKLLGRPAPAGSVPIIKP